MLRSFIINHFIALEKLKTKWSKDTILANVVYNNPVNDISELSFAQRKGFKQIQNILLPETGTGIISKSFQKKSGVIELVANYTDESFAIVLSNAIYEQLAEFYLQQSAKTPDAAGAISGFTDLARQAAERIQVWLMALSDHQD